MLHRFWGAKMSKGDVEDPFMNTAGAFVYECDLPVAKEEPSL